MARWIVTNTPFSVLAVVFLIGLPAATIGVQALIRRRLPALAAGRHNDVAGFLLAVVGVLYAVVAAFVVVSMWQQFSEARETVSTEASSLRLLVRDTAVFGDPVHSRIEARVETYLERVTQDEWGHLGVGRAHPAAGSAFDDLYHELQAVTSDTATEEAFLTTAIDHLDDAADARHDRLHLANDALPSVLWIALLLSSAITILFSLAFALEDARIHFAMVGGLAMLVGVMLLPMLVLDFPFAGDVAVESEPLVTLLEELRAV
jgi:hypothetical protein